MSDPDQAAGSLALSICSVQFEFISVLLFLSAQRHSADQLLLDFGPCGEEGVAEGEGVPARLQPALARAREVRLDQAQLGRGSRALGLRLGLAQLGLVQRGGRPVVEVRVRVRVGERVQPGVVEAFFCRGSLPVHTNTITLWMRGNSRTVYITDGLPGSSDSLNPFSRRRRPYYFSTFWFGKPQKKHSFCTQDFSPLPISQRLLKH